MTSWSAIFMCVVAIPALGQGTGVWTPRSTAGPPRTGTGLPGISERPALASLSDVIWQGSGTGLHAWALRGPFLANAFLVTRWRSADPRWQLRGLADFNGDGKTDTLWQRWDTGELAAWFMDDARVLSRWSLEPSHPIDPGWRVRGVGDLDGDGRPDILWRHRVTGRLHTWLMDGVRIAGKPLKPEREPDLLWQVRGLEDFDGDGSTDVLWQHEGSGTLYVWYLNGLVKRGGAYLGPAHPPTTPWRIVRVGDLDGDGDADILWHNPLTTELLAWSLDRVGRAAQTPLQPSRVRHGLWTLVPK